MAAAAAARCEEDDEVAIEIEPGALVDARQTPSAANVAAPVPCDERLGRYRLRFALATGGMATVYLAVAEEGPNAGHVFAVKRIHPHLALSSEFVDMFRDEARLASLLHHPNVCGVLDYADAHATGGAEPCWLAMELLVGAPLARLLGTRARKRVDPAMAARWPLVAARLVAEACEGLHVAHELRDESGRPLQVVHRDVSPHNVFVGFDGHAKVVDFGIASAAHRLHHTATGMVKGKFAYMAPEQMRGHRVDRRADVWSLGVVLWESIVGRPLFRGETESETILRALGAEVPPLASVAPHAGPELAAVVDRALRVPVGERYESARELGQDLWRIVHAAAPSVSAPEVAGWMDALFPGEHERQRAIAESARDGADSSAPRPALVVPWASGEDSRSQLAPRSAVVRRAGQPPRSASRALLVAGAIVLGAVILALGIVVGSHTGTPTGRAAPAPPDVPTEARTRPPETRVVRSADVADVPRTEPLSGSDPWSSTTTRARADATSRVARPDDARLVSGHRAERPSEGPTGRTGEARTSARDRSTAEADPNARGEVHVATSGGWAVVSHRGRRLGPTPGIFRLPVGRQTLTLRAQGSGPPQRETVNVRRGAVVRLRVALAPAAGLASR
ncbi:MAG: protein kinase [Deltaproteobacteria bacterium]|nr:protein kinase [Deltaproteobacteria bacterium]